MPFRPPDNRTKAERRRDAIFGERPPVGAPATDPERVGLSSLGYFEGDCTRCKKLKRPQAHTLVRYTRTTDRGFAIPLSFGGGAYGYLCYTCDQELAGPVEIGTPVPIFNRHHDRRFRGKVQR